MTTNYKTRLKIPLKGNPSTNFYSPSGLKLASGYTRVVIGERGPYIEFTANQILSKNFHIDKDQEYRKTDQRVYYVEARSRCESNVKLYYQKKKVAYADYLLGYYYISAFDVRTDEHAELVSPA